MLLFLVYTHTRINIYKQTANILFYFNIQYSAFIKKYLKYLNERDKSHEAIIHVILSIQIYENSIQYLI